MGGYMYILLCSNGRFYTGSTRSLDKRVEQHRSGNGANYTKKRLPVKLVYYEEFETIYKAYYREKQIQNWSQSKKKALISCNPSELKKGAECQNKSASKNRSMGFDLPGLIKVWRINDLSSTAL